MPSVNTRITRIAAKPSSLATTPILESCPAMPRPRVPLSSLERVSARPTIRAPPKSQPLPAVSKPLPAASLLTKKPELTKRQIPEPLSQRAAAVLERVKARSKQLAAAKRADEEARIKAREDARAATEARLRALEKERIAADARLKARQEARVARQAFLDDLDARAAAREERLRQKELRAEEERRRRSE